MNSRSGAAVVLAGTVALSSCQALANGGPTTPEPTGSAATALRHLRIANPDDHGHRYDRDRFGEPWADTDHNGCDTRDDVLARDMRHERLDSDGCTVLAGVLHDRYTGRAIRFHRGRTSSLAVQIDHVVPLHAAWLHGAWSWSPAKRQRIANDRRNLLAVDGPTNEGKGDQTPAEWRPPRRGEWCDYATRYVRVSAAYHLSISRGDRTALRSMLGTC